MCLGKSSTNMATSGLDNGSLLAPLCIVFANCLASSGRFGQNAVTLIPMTRSWERSSLFHPHTINYCLSSERNKRIDSRDVGAMADDVHMLYPISFPVPGTQLSLSSHSLTIVIVKADIITTTTSNLCSSRIITGTAFVQIPMWETNRQPH